MSNQVAIKTYSDTYLYGIGEYEKNLFKFLMESEVIDKNDPSFDDIKYDVKKRQVTSVLTKVLDSNNVVLLKHAAPLPRAFKVFVATDVRNGSKQKKVFIDVSDIILNQDGRYTCPSKSIDILVSYLVSAMQSLIYQVQPNSLINNFKLTECGTICFSKLFTYVIDYLRIGGVDNIREKTTYLSSIYYQVSLLGLDLNDTVKSRALKLSGLSSRDTDILMINTDENSFDNINNFITTLAKIIKADSLKLDNFLDKWMHLYGSGTHFATELHPAFSSMLTNTYVGAYINNQKAIEKIVGRDMIDYSTALFKIGGELVK